MKVAGCGTKPSPPSLPSCLDQEGRMSDVKRETVKYLDCDLPKLVMSGPLSRNTLYTLHVTGPWRIREAENLIAVLQLHLDWLREDAASEAPASTTEPGPSQEPDQETRHAG
jgi:hypothetical protein